MMLYQTTYLYYRDCVGLNRAERRFYATPTRTTVFVDGNALTASQLNNEFNNLLNALNLVNADVSASAGIVFSKLDATTVAGVSQTQTLTNKRLTKRTGSTTSSATPTINTDNVDIYELTAQAADITSFTANLSGTPTDGQPLIISITGTGSHAITWGSSFESSTVTLPTTLSTSRLDVGFLWNAVTSKWRCVASA